MKWYGGPERIDADRMLDCGACMVTGTGRCADCWRRTGNGELLNFAAIAANAAEHQLDPEEADAEFNAVLVDLDADDASFLVDLMFYQGEGGS